MKKLIAGLVVLFSTFNILAEPGGTYTLTGNEKGLSEIIKADMEKYPNLYKGESLNSYISKFKKENQIGKRKLSPGDVLRFPETMASIKAKKQKPSEQSQNNLHVVLTPAKGFSSDKTQKIKSFLESKNYQCSIIPKSSAAKPEKSKGDIWIRIAKENGNSVVFGSDDSKDLAKEINNLVCRKIASDSRMEQQDWPFLVVELPSILINLSQENADTVDALDIARLLDGAISDQFL